MFPDPAPPAGGEPTCATTSTEPSSSQDLAVARLYPEYAMNEPRSPETVAAWIDTAQRARDPFERVRRASDEHREKHGAGCSVYPTSSGPLLAVLAATIAAERILEVGCGLGYSALCLADGSGGRVETIE